MGMNRGCVKKKGEDPGPRRVPYLKVHNGLY